MRKKKNKRTNNISQYFTRIALYCHCCTTIAELNPRFPVQQPGWTPVRIITALFL